MNIKNKLKPSLLIANTSWLLSSEFIAKLTRILTLIVIARELSTTDYGIAFLALACHDVFRIFLRSGTGSLIIQCKEEVLPEYLKNGATVQWLICLFVFSIQYFSAQPLSLFFNKPELESLLKIMAISYFFYPIVSNNVFLLQRKNKMKFFSLANACCIIVENLGIIIFLLLNFGIQSVAYSKILFGFFWLGFFAFSPEKYYKISFNPSLTCMILMQSAKIFLSEGLKAVRLQLDIIVAGKLLSPELLGIYSFAKSAGVGLSQSLSNAYIGALYPYICKLQRSCQLQQKRGFIVGITALVSCIFICQSLAVPVYVPIIFGEKWDTSHLITSLLCLIAIPTVIIDTYCSFQRAKRKLLSEFFTRLCCLIATLTAIVFYNIDKPLDLAVAMLTGSLFWLLFISLNTFSSSVNTLTNQRKKAYEY